jgi:predicted S18 family serine protease
MKKILAAVLLLLVFASPAFASKHNRQYPHRSHHHHQHPHA